MGRVIGTEVEYGITAPGELEVSPIVTSTQAVIAYAAAHGVGGDRTRWDFGPESPLRDSRGFDLRRYRANEAPVIDPNAIGAANLVLPNGARFYVDHAHPEFSAPEVTDARSAVVWDRAGEEIMLRAAELASVPEGRPELRVYKNNVDGKGASYGTHENYLVRRDVDFDTLAAALIPFLVTRQVFAGAGRVGLGTIGQEAGFQISQRADYIDTDISLETTLNRGIINTRDEPHANADRWRRLHVIIGDANLAETATFLKVGTTALVLDAIEAGVDFSDLTLRDPVGDVRRVSRDLTCRDTLELDDHINRLSAIEIQRQYLSRALASRTSSRPLDATEQQVAQTWSRILDQLEQDPLSTSGELDWTAKLALLDGARRRGGLGWENPKLGLIDLQYSDLDPARGLHRALLRRGRMARLTTDAEVAAAVRQPPEDTRAWFRGTVIARFPDDVVAAGWDGLIVRVTPGTAGTGKDGLLRLNLTDPVGLTRATAGDAAASAATMDDLVAALGAHQNLNREGDIDV